MNIIDDITAGLTDIAIVALFLVVPVALLLGYKVRTKTNFTWPKDFYSFGVLGALLVILWAQSRYDVEVPSLWVVLFVTFYLLGFRLGKNVTDKGRVELIYIGQTSEGNLVIGTMEHDYIRHKEHGLCQLPENNRELFNQSVRGIYHKVEANAPLDMNVILKDVSPAEVKTWKPPYDNIEDERTDLTAILIEDIDTIYEPDKTRFLSPRVPRTVIRMARGSAVPKAKLLFEFDAMDQCNKALAKATAETLKVKTEIIPALPGISATQLVGMAENHPVYEVIKKAMKAQEATDD